MKNQTKLQYILIALLCAMLATRAKAQELNIALKVNNTYIGCCGDTVYSPYEHNNFSIETNPFDPIALGWSFKVKRYAYVVPQGGDYKLWDLPTYGKYDFYVYYLGMPHITHVVFYVKKQN